MSFGGFTEFIEQARIVWAALEALRAIMAVLFCLALATFVVYLIGVWRLRRAEDGLKKVPGSRKECLHEGTRSFAKEAQ